MRKLLIIILCAVLGAGIIVGAVFGIRALVNRNKVDDSGRHYNIMMLEDEYTVGDNVIFDFYVFDDTKFVKMTYSINNGAEVHLTGIENGDAVDHEAYEKGFGKFYADSRAQIISTDDMSAGYYMIVFYGYDSDDVRSQLNANPYQFKLTAPSTAA